MKSVAASSASSATTSSNTGYCRNTTHIASRLMPSPTFIAWNRSSKCAGSKPFSSMSFKSKVLRSISTSSNGSLISGLASTGCTTLALEVPERLCLALALARWARFFCLSGEAMQASSLSGAAIFMARDNRAHIVFSLGRVRWPKGTDLFFLLSTEPSCAEYSIFGRSQLLQDTCVVLEPLRAGHKVAVVEDHRWDTADTFA